MTQSTSSRRDFLARTGTVAAATALPAPFIHAQPAKIKVGMMLPSTGAFAPLGAAITNGFRMAVAELVEGTPLLREHLC